MRTNRQYTWYGRLVLTEFELANPPNQCNQKPYQGVCTTGRLTITGQLLPQPNNPIYEHVKRTVWASSLNEAFIKLAEWKDIIRIEQINLFNPLTLEPIPQLATV